MTGVKPAERKDMCLNESTITDCGESALACPLCETARKMVSIPGWIDTKARIFMTLNRHLTAALLMLAGVQQFALAGAQEPQAAPVAHFSFNGHARNDAPGKAEFDLRQTEFRDDALWLNGIYEFGPESGGYHAVCRTPDFQFTAFTVALRFRAEEFAKSKTNLLVGGTRYRWFGLERSAAGSLTVFFNNRKILHEIEIAPLNAGEWIAVACGVDLAARTVVVYLNDRPAAEFDLPADFQLNVIGTRESESDKVWSFVNYSNTNLFHGLVDELIIHNRLLSAAEFQDQFHRMPRKRTDADSKKDDEGLAADFLTKLEREVLDLTNRERFKVGAPPLKANRRLTEAARGHAANMARQQILNHTLDGKRFDERIEAQGYRSSAAGENIWSAATAAQAVAGWMGSPGHQRNLLNREYKEIGIGVGTGKSNQKYWTQVFATPDATQPAPLTNRPPGKK